MSQSGSDKKTANSLIALSSAAVLAVYTAGFMRTKAAAAHLEALEARVRPGMTASHGAAPDAMASFTPETAERGEALPAAPAAVTAAAPVAPAAVKVEASKAPPPSSAPVAAAETPVAPPPVVAEAPAPATVPTPVEAPAPVVATPPAPVVAAPPAQPTWKDGSYLGWGSARHGSIQASVEVTGGHITVAKIEQCQMRYSCNVIERLIPQVAERGNPEKIDYISGATESSNVFYWALIDALSKAK